MAARPLAETSTTIAGCSRNSRLISRSRGETDFGEFGDDRLEVLSNGSQAALINDPGRAVKGFPGRCVSREMDNHVLVPTRRHRGLDFGVEFGADSRFDNAHHADESDGEDGHHKDGRAVDSR